MERMKMYYRSRQIPRVQQNDFRYPDFDRSTTSVNKEIAAITGGQAPDYGSSSYLLDPITIFPPDRLISHQYTGLPPKMPPKKALVRPRFSKINQYPIYPVAKDSYIRESRVPQRLTNLLIIFLVVIGAVYLRKRYTFQMENMFNILNTKYTLCKCNLRNNCIQSNWLEPTHQMVRKLFSQLNGRARLHYCQDSRLPLTLPFSEFAEGLPDTQHTLAIKFLPHLISQNPQWGMAIMDSPIFKEPHFEITEPRLPFQCLVSDNFLRFCNLFRKFDISWILWSLVPIVPILLYYKARRQEAQSVIYDFKNAIINELLQRKWHNNESIFLIDHLQEKLVPFENRSKYLPLWNQALKLLEKNYKRLVFRKVNLNGKVMRTISFKELH
ncbi:hypothetical protein KR026_001541 [Drosophila bipectinata]|nr:hypothetical protein KR026_001541 [Drosophila bipectinata]